MADDKDDELYAQLYGGGGDAGDGEGQTTAEATEEGGGYADDTEDAVPETEGFAEAQGAEGEGGEEQAAGEGGDDEDGDEGYEDEDESDEDVVIVLEEKDKQGAASTTTPTRVPAHAGKNLSIRNPISIGKGVSAAKPKQSGGPTAPSPQKESVMNLNLDELEDKPWRKPGADITDYFNYGFNEETWKGYCAKQLQLRMEQTMQTKISVWESQKSNDLPPELLSAMNAANNGMDQSRMAMDKNRPMIPRGGGGIIQRGGRLPMPPTIPAEWERPEPARRRMRDQDESVIQVLGGGDSQDAENEFAVPTTGGPSPSPSGYPPPGMEHFPGYGYPPGFPMGQMGKGYPPMPGQFPPMRGGRGRGDPQRGGRGRGGFRGAPYFPPDGNKEGGPGGDFADRERSPAIKEERDRRRDREEPHSADSRDSRDSKDRRRSSSRERADREKRPVVKEEPRSRDSRDRDSAPRSDTTSSSSRSSERDGRDRDRERDSREARDSRDRDRERERSERERSERDRGERDARSRREAEDTSSQKRSKPASSREEEESRAKRRR